MQLDRHADAQREPDELLRRDRAGRLPHRPPGARASTSPTTRCCRPASSPTSTPSSPGWAGRTSTRSRSTARTRRSTTCCATASTSTPCTAGWRRTSRTRSTAAARSSRVPTRARSSTCPVTVPEATKVRENPASFDDHFSQARLFWRSMTPGRAGAHRPRLHLRARQVLRAGDQGAAAARPGQHRPGAVRRGRARPRPARAGAHRRSRRAGAQPGAVADRRHLAGRRPHRRDRRRPRRRPGRGRRAARGAAGRRCPAAAHRPARRRAGRRASWPAHLRHRPLDRVRRRPRGGRRTARARRARPPATARPVTTRRS